MGNLQYVRVNYWEKSPEQPRCIHPELSYLVSQFAICHFWKQHQVDFLPIAPAGHQLWKSLSMPSSLVRIQWNGESLDLQEMAALQQHLCTKLKKKRVFLSYNTMPIIGGGWNHLVQPAANQGSTIAVVCEKTPAIYSLLRWLWFAPLSGFPILRCGAERQVH